MKVSKTRLYQLLDGAKQFSVPVYQRPYTWNEEQCEQIWRDAVGAAEGRSDRGHFIGSIVCIDSGANSPSGVQEYQVVDGQQRLTTISLMLLAIADADPKSGIADADRSKIRNRYLVNPDEEGGKRHKLVLTERDKDAMFALVGGKARPRTHSAVLGNYDFFAGKISGGADDLSAVLQGALNLSIVDISLDRSEDDPQLIFESLNSTGRRLRDSDHIRNHILMNLESGEQEEIYRDHWRPMESKFDKGEDLPEFDDFIKDYLVFKRGSDIRKADVYPEFKELVRGAASNRALAEEMHHSADLYVRLVHAAEPDGALRQKTLDVKVLGRTAYPFLLEVYHDYDEGRITKEDAIGAFSLVESYVVRRAACAMPSNGYNKMFAKLAGQIDKGNYLESLKIAFVRQPEKRRFPSDSEFAKALRFNDIYNMRTLPKYVLDRLENHGHKERVDVSDAKIEHVMPQRLGEEWKRDLGADWERVHYEYLHTLGNLTLTGYNPELGNRPFAEKRDMAGGYAESPLRLNGDLASAEKWGEDQMRSRAERLVQRACEIWKHPAPHSTAEAYGSEDDEDDPDEDDPASPAWDEVVSAASLDNRRAVEALVSGIRGKFDCVDESRKSLRYFWTKRPLSRKHLFAVVRCGKNTARISFRIDPDSFSDDGTVKVDGWFFPKGTERRMPVKAESVDRIIRMLEHAVGAAEA